MTLTKAVLRDLTLEQKYRWVDALLVSIHEEESAHGIPQSQIRMLRRRFERLKANPGQGRDFERVLDELEREK